MVASWRSECQTWPTPILAGGEFRGVFAAGEWGHGPLPADGVLLIARLARPLLWSSRPTDTTHPRVALARRKCTRACTGGHGTRLPFTGLNDTDDVLTLALRPRPTDGKSLYPWVSRPRL